MWKQLNFFSLSHALFDSSSIIQDAFVKLRAILKKQEHLESQPKAKVVSGYQDPQKSVWMRMCVGVAVSWR